MDKSKIHESNLISRDLSWLNFNYRVLDQAKDSKKNVLERLNFRDIVASKVDDFFESWVGGLFKYIDNNKKGCD